MILSAIITNKGVIAIKLLLVLLEFGAERMCLRARTWRQPLRPSLPLDALGGGGSCTHATPQALKAAEPCATFPAPLGPGECPTGRGVRGRVGGRWAPTPHPRQLVCSVFSRGLWKGELPARCPAEITRPDSSDTRLCCTSLLASEWGCHRGPRGWLRSGAGVNKAALSGFPGPHFS